MSFIPRVTPPLNASANPALAPIYHHPSSITSQPMMLPPNSIQYASFNGPTAMLAPTTVSFLPTSHQQPLSSPYLPPSSQQAPAVTHALTALASSNAVPEPSSMPMDSPHLCLPAVQPNCLYQSNPHAPPPPPHLQQEHTSSMSVVFPNSQLQHAQSANASSSNNDSAGAAGDAGAATVDPALSAQYGFSLEEEPPQEPQSTELPLDILIDEINPDLMVFFNERPNILDYLLANEDYAKKAAIAAAAAAAATSSENDDPMASENTTHPQTVPIYSSTQDAPSTNAVAGSAASGKSGTTIAAGISSNTAAAAVAATAGSAPVVNGVPPAVGPSPPVIPSHDSQNYMSLHPHSQQVSVPCNQTYARTYVQPHVLNQPIPQTVAPITKFNSEPHRNVRLNNPPSCPSHAQPVENLSPSASVSALNHPDKPAQKTARPRPSSPRKRRGSSPANKSSRNSSSRSHAQGSSSRRSSPSVRVRRVRTGEKRDRPSKDSSLVVAAAANRVKKEAIPHPAAPSPSNSTHPPSCMNGPSTTPTDNPPSNAHSIVLPPNVKPDSVGAAAAVAAMAAVQSATGGTSELRMDTANESISEEKVEGEGDPKKLMRAERNRQSAAASRERKKGHIKELERRVTLLSEQNAKLQVHQLQQIRDRLAEEGRLVMENDDLRRTVIFKEMEISKLSAKLKSHNIDEDEGESSLRRHTWDHSLWHKQCGKK